MDYSYSEPIRHDTMDPETYLKERVEDQIAWYDRKAAFEKISFISLRVVEITAAATVPFSLGSPATRGSVRPWA